MAFADTNAFSITIAPAYAIVGDSYISIIPSAVMEFTAPTYSIVGDSYITIIPSAEMQYTLAAAIIGDSFINIIPSAIMLYTKSAKLATGKTFTGQTQQRTFTGRQR